MRARSLQIVAALGLGAALGGCNPAGYPTCFRVECPYPPVYQNSYAGYVPAYTDGRPAFGEPPFDNTLQANDIDLFLMGDVERKKKYTEFVTSGGGLQGPYGHILDAK